MSYITHVNFRADDITDEEYEAAISELEAVDGVEVEERKQDAAMVANSDAGASLALMAGTLAVTSVDTLVNIYKLARSNPAFYHMWTRNEDGHQIEPWAEDRMEMYRVEEDDEIVLAKVEGDNNDVDVQIDGPVYFVDSNGASMFPDDEAEEED
ncbi:hypothetical protein [Haloarcula marina]|uniref:hypothetical protein n=1 Tax=Haloarcula marina TaxID=2961574 RepID=UPI0020B820B1|nr:hypothetical protein [Halomicroarcula marina]